MSVMWVNDNTAALAWAEKGRVSNLSSQFACISVNWLQLMGSFNLIDCMHIPGVTMGDIDKESREKLAPSL